MKGNAIRFTEDEKAMLTARLNAAAAKRKRPFISRRTVKVCVFAAASALTLVFAGAAGAFDTPLFDKAEARLSFEGQALPLEAKMSLNPDGTATIIVDGGENYKPTVITAPKATADALLKGETDCGFQVTRTDGEPYRLEEQDGRVWLFVNGRIPLDVTELLKDGYTFSYTDNDGNSRTALVSGTTQDYEVNIK